MCGRYIYLDENNKEMKLRIDQLKKFFSEDELRNVSLHEVFPSQKTPVYTLCNDELIPKIMQFGYNRFNNKGLIINARCETVNEKPTFRSDFLKRRCIVIASSYFEWDSSKKKHEFKKKDSLLYMAAICNQEDQMAILTRKAQDNSAAIHERCPLILTYDQALAYCSYTLKGQFPAPVLQIEPCK